MLSVDNIFYGSSIKPGSISLEFYQTGTLCAKAQDTKKNGVLIRFPENSIEKDLLFSRLINILFLFLFFTMLMNSI